MVENGLKILKTSKIVSGYLFKIEDFIDLYRPEKAKMAEIRFPALYQSGPSTRQVLSFVEN